MQMIQCPNCARLTGFKRALGFGTFFMVLLTAGLWLLVIPFYPARCITCSLTRHTAVFHNFSVWYRSLSPAARAFVVIAPLALLFGLGIFNALMNTTQRNPPPPSTARGSDIFRWPTEGLPAYIVDALSTPDLAPDYPGDGAHELILGIAGQKQFVPSVNDDDCSGSGGCVWTIRDFATQRKLLPEPAGSCFTKHRRLQTDTTICLWRVSRGCIFMNTSVENMKIRPAMVEAMVSEAPQY